MRERTINSITLDGGCLCFDLINTVSSHKESPEYEYISSYTDLLQWSRRVNALPEERLVRLGQLFRDSTSETTLALDYFMETRETLYHFFSALAAKRSPAPETGLLFNRAVQEAIQHLYFNSGRLPVSLEWQDSRLDLKEPVWAALKSAWDVICNEDQNRIKECEACGWLFLDRTKNNRKRWCNPSFCGSADKARRYYQRKKEKQLPRL